MIDDDDDASSSSDASDSNMIDDDDDVPVLQMAFHLTCSLVCATFATKIDWTCPLSIATTDSS